MTTQPRKPKPIPTTAERLEDMERQWKEANGRQKVAIDRLMLMRERVLKVVGEAPDHAIQPKLREAIIKELNE